YYRLHRDLHSFPTRRSSDLLVVPLIHDLAPGFDRQGSEHFSLSAGAKVQPEISAYYWNLRARGYSSARANHLSQYRGGGVQNHRSEERRVGKGCRTRRTRED